MNRQTYRRGAFTLVEALVVLAILAMLVALMMPMHRSAPEAARRNKCLNNLKQIGLALIYYEETHGSLPPAYTVDSEGRPLHSWRTLILPYLEQADLYESIDLSKPWDDPANAAAREVVVEAYNCPSAIHEVGETTYLAVVGPDCAFVDGQSRDSSSVTDSRSSTIAVIDAHSERAVHWMAPQDISPADLEVMIDGKTTHPGVFLAAFLDGHTTALQPGIDRSVLRSLLTVAGGEALEEF